ncbi:MAG: 1-deoxy-D-xylulose-5-phosphate reductoisomerase [Acidimicrobiia bacterium]|nr:1-deoxy-D-xylulose-5-phosphate reductoisomerase [Acidimicrobiia bacterium]
MTAPVVVLGATGSIGTQALDVAARLDIPVAGIAARQGSDRLLAMAAAHPDSSVAVAAPTADERDRFVSRLGPRVGFGLDAVEALASRSGVIVINGIVGAAGLGSSVAALEAGNRLGLANKESLVAGGEVVLAAARRGGGEIIPVDSEHSAIYQCLVGEGKTSVARIVLTASGGPFLGRRRDELESVTPVEALAHPTWDMGRRISVDSATLVNKGLEVIEAHHLFGIPYDRIDVVVHPQSIVHSLVEFVDGSLKAHVGFPDMRVPIQYALTAPDRRPGALEPFSLAGRTLGFEHPDREAFPALDLAYEAGRTGGVAPGVFNAADEIAVAAFLGGRLGFLGIVDVIAATLGQVSAPAPTSIEEVLAADSEARAVAASLIAGSC